MSWFVMVASTLFSLVMIYGFDTHLIVFNYKRYPSFTAMRYSANNLPGGVQP